MYTSRLSEKTAAAGAFEIDRRARQLQIHLDRMEASWMAENKPSESRDLPSLKDLFARLQVSLTILPNRQLVGATHK